jgi:ADP-heptose:LPS heptosyltransferase
MHKRSEFEIPQLISQNPESRIQNPEIPESAHQVFEYLNLAATLGANPERLLPQLFVSPKEIEAAKKKFGLDKITQLIFGLNPGAEYGVAKRWPSEKFIAAAKKIQQRTNCVWILFGGKGDAELTARIASEIQHLASQSCRKNFFARTHVVTENLPRPAHQRHRPDARRHSTGNARGRAVRQHVAGTDRARVAR